MKSLAPAQNHHPGKNQKSWVRFLMLEGTSLKKTFESRQGDLESKNKSLKKTVDIKREFFWGVRIPWVGASRMCESSKKSLE